MPLDVNEIDSPLADRHHLIYTANLFQRMADTNFKKALARYKKHYNKHVRFETHFAASYDVFAECTPLLKFAKNGMDYEGYSKLLLHRTGPYRVVSVGTKYARIVQNTVLDTVSINRLARALKEARSSVDVTSYSRADSDAGPTK